MRITTRQITSNYIFNANNTMSKYAGQFEKLETGRGFERLSQNVSLGKKALRNRTAIYRNAQYSANVESAREQMSAAENALMSINDQVQNVSSLAEKAMSGTNTDETSRRIFSEALEETKRGMLDNLNSMYLDKYILGGTNGETPYTVSDSGELLYNGIAASEITGEAGSYTDANGDPVELSGVTYVDIGLGLRLKPDGESFDENSVFKMSFPGLEWTGYGKSDITYEDKNGVEVTETVSNNMYDILTEMQSALEANDTERLGALREHLENGFDDMLVGIANLGTRSAFLESKGNQLADEATDLEVIRKNVEGINDADEITKMQEYSYSWLLTLRFGSQILPQSLMDYIR
ncbi:MAG: hypothetical protein IJ555_01560 [Ruminococcus sp.]|nr:hypothetical protein [Ruminococcus sp.]MBR1752409.1 hypothetical protein [Ruminococcus sp.]